MLYSLLHAISRTGCDNSSIDQVFDYLKRSFQFTDAKHEELLSTVRHRTVSDAFSVQLVVQVCFWIGTIYLISRQMSRCSWASSKRATWRARTSTVPISLTDVILEFCFQRFGPMNLHDNWIVRRYEWSLLFHMDFEQPPKVSGYVHETEDVGSRLERDAEFVRPIKMNKFACCRISASY